MKFAEEKVDFFIFMQKALIRPQNDKNVILLTTFYAFLGIFLCILENLA